MRAMIQPLLPPGRAQAWGAGVGQSLPMGLVAVPPSPRLGDGAAIPGGAEHPLSHAALPTCQPGYIYPGAGGEGLG